MRSPWRANAQRGRQSDRHPRADAQRGTVTAEFAAVVPAVLMVLAMCLGSMQVAGVQLRLQDAAADASRSLARGEGAAVASARLRLVVSGAQLSVRRHGDLVCADARAPAAPGIGWMSALTVSASGCAVDGGL
jgi:hypothetical protein